VECEVLTDSGQSGECEVLTESGQSVECEVLHAAANTGKYVLLYVSCT